MPALEDSFHLGIKVLLRNIEEKFLLLERAHKTRGTYWDIPGGRIHKNESITEALKREIEEETCEL